MELVILIEEVGVMRKKKEKSIYDQIRKPMPRPGKVITPQKGKGTYDRKKEKNAQFSEEPHEKSWGFCLTLETNYGSPTSIVG